MLLLFPDPSSDALRQLIDVLRTLPHPAEGTFAFTNGGDIRAGIDPESDRNAL